MRFQPEPGDGTALIGLMLKTVLRSPKGERRPLKRAAHQTVISLFSDISEANYTGAAKRQRLVEEMRNRLHSDVRIDADDI